MKTCLNIASGIALVIAAATGASAQDAQPKQTLMPENEEARAFQEAVGYSSAVIHGDTIYLSGVVAGPTIPKSLLTSSGCTRVGPSSKNEGEKARYGTGGMMPCWMGLAAEL